jgi:phosphohistidine swiveling domain-containing protein
MPSPWSGYSTAAPRPLLTASVVIVARASARRIGDHLERDGKLDSGDDVFLLTVDELTRSLPQDARTLVALRRERREQYQKLVVPSYWKGQPSPLADKEIAETGDVVTGIGVSEGVVEGAVRVVETPDFANVKADEVLVAPTTDPSWSSIMFVSSALVVDIGGALSHAAVVARELSLPCVVNTRTGTHAAALLELYEVIDAAVEIGLPMMQTNVTRPELMKVYRALKATAKNREQLVNIGRWMTSSQSEAIEERFEHDMIRAPLLTGLPFMPFDADLSGWSLIYLGVLSRYGVAMFHGGTGSLPKALIASIGEGLVQAAGLAGVEGR